MYKLSKFLSVAAIFLVAMIPAPAQRRPYLGNYQSVRQLILRIENGANVLRNDISASSDRGRGDWRSQQDLNRLASDFQNAVYRLRTDFERRQSTTAEVQIVLDRATGIDNLLGQARVSGRAQNDWSNLRGDLSELARTFGLSWSSSSGTYPNQSNYPNQGNYPNQSNYPNEGNYPSQSNYPRQPYYRGDLLTGSYRLDPSRSDDAVSQANRATESLPSADRQRVRDRLSARLESPDQISIERRGRTIIIASSRAPQITFEADGSERLETTRSGRTIRARATLSGEQLNVSSRGDSGNEFSVTFNPIENGRRLEVTRRLYVEGLNAPVQVRSLYEKTSDVARFDIYNETSPSGQTYPTGSNADFIIRNGETVVAQLDNPLSTETVQEGDRFTMNVIQPSTYSGATIEGHVTNVERSGRLTGRSQMTLNFDTIRLPDGRSYRFAGLVESVRTAQGDTVRVDNEGTVKDESQSTKTAQRAAIGTALGAIIGAIAGGGKGAAIGAIVGAGGGAGSVYVQGQNDLNMDRGTQITIRASGPQ